MIFDLTREQYQERLREAVELATDRATRSWRMGEVMCALLEIMKAEEFPTGRFCKGCGTTDLPPRRSSWCSQECQDDFYSKFLWQWVVSRVLDEHNCCWICGIDRSIPKEGVKLGYSREHGQYIDCDYIRIDCKYGGISLWQVHHIQPVNANGGGGRVFDRDNLAMVCTKCHGVAHRELNEEHRPSPEQKMRNDGYTLLEDYGPERCTACGGIVTDDDNDLIIGRCSCLRDDYKRGEQCY